MAHLHLKTGAIRVESLVMAGKPKLNYRHVVPQQCKGHSSGLCYSGLITQRTTAYNTGILTAIGLGSLNDAPHLRHGMTCTITGYVSP